jgi:hypothetical protein
MTGNFDTDSTIAVQLATGDVVGSLLLTILLLLLISFFLGIQR